MSPGGGGAAPHLALAMARSARLAAAASSSFSVPTSRVSMRVCYTPRPVRLFAPVWSWGWRPRRVEAIRLGSGSLLRDEGVGSRLLTLALRALRTNEDCGGAWAVWCSQQQPTRAPTLVSASAASCCCALPLLLCAATGSSVWSTLDPPLTAVSVARLPLAPACEALDGRDRARVRAAAATCIAPVVPSLDHETSTPSPTSIITLVKLHAHAHIPNNMLRTSGADGAISLSGDAGLSTEGGGRCNAAAANPTLVRSVDTS